MTTGLITAGHPPNVEALAAVAESALASGDEATTIPAVRDGAVRNNNALLWQWTALLQRSLDDHADALQSFERAAELAPQDRTIAHGRAQTALEAGLPAVELFEQARRLAPGNGEVLLGWAAAMAASGEADRAVIELRAALRLAPMWVVGHEQLAQLLATVGRRGETTALLEEALAQFPRAASLWNALLNVELKREAHASIEPILRQARAAGAESPEFALYDAIHAAAFDERVHPPALFDAAPAALSDVLQSWRVRHLLRLGVVEAALPILDQGLAGNYASELWPYAATAWRMTGDPRSQWLERDDELVRVVDLGDALPSLDALADHLLSLHVAKGEYLDQSVRGGTQTDGPLFSRIHPLIRGLRGAVVEAVQSYAEQLPPIDLKHPLLRHRRNRPIRFSGSWSVRLRSGGRHANHVHPQGWISSALYIALPQRQPGEPDNAGWLTLGEPDEALGLEVPPVLRIEPAPGRLVLFPSWMWHGTVPFAFGERLTVAFDVRPPM